MMHQLHVFVIWGVPPLGGVIVDVSSQLLASNERAFFCWSLQSHPWPSYEAQCHAFWMWGARHQIYSEVEVVCKFNWAPIIFERHSPDINTCNVIWDVRSFVQNLNAKQESSAKFQTQHPRDRVIYLRQTYIHQTLIAFFGHVKTGLRGI